MPDAEEDQCVISETSPTSNFNYRPNIEKFSKNVLKFLKDNDIEDARNVLELAVIKSKVNHGKMERYCHPSKDCQLQKSQESYYAKMKEFAGKLPRRGGLSKLSDEDWEMNIRNLISSSLRYRYIDIFEDQMFEMKARYYEAMHDLAVRRVIAIDCQDPCNVDLKHIPPYKLAGRTEFYSKYLRNRCTFQKKYYLPHRLIRNIVARAHLLMPEWICDFGRYRKTMDYLDFNRFLDLVESDIKKGALAIASNYYSDIVRLISQPRFLYDVPTHFITDFLNCANNLLALQVVTRMINTIEYMLQILEDEQTVPLFKLQLKCENNELSLCPTMREICSAFHTILDQISRVGQQLPPLDSWVGVKIQREHIKVLLPEWYLGETHRRLAEVLENTFRSFTDYVEELSNKFRVVFDPEMRKNIVSYVSTGLSFQECVAKVEDFNEFIREINGMPNHEYFSIGIIHQIAAKEELLRYTDEVRTMIIEELVKSHQNYNFEICNTFESIKERALNVPNTTKELLELGEYMLMAASTLMRSLEEKITLSLRMMASLIGMTTLTKDHIELNNTTIHWLKRIRPIFEQNSAAYEQIKYELEEKLVKKIEILNMDVENMFPRLEIMNDMDDASRIREYIEFMRKFARSFDRMDERVKSINDEENLFQYPPSQYPRINELKENVMPYYELIYRGYQWQRHRDVWLDGPFEYLDSNDIENKTTDYFADFNKISKQYRTKIKLELATNYPYSFKGSPDDPDPFQQPAPLKICHQLIEDIKWFKYYIPLLTVFRNPAMRQIHWDEMSVIAGFDLTPDAGTTFRKIINMDLMEEIEKYETISISATKQLGLAELLAKMISEWDNVIFTIVLYKDSGVNILTQLDDIQALLEEHIVKVQAMRGSAFVKLIEEEVKHFYFLLLRIQSTIEEWTKVQVQWMYLLPIFSSKDIVAQLPEEEILFSQVDRIFRSSMKSVAKDPRVRETAGSVGLLEIMQEANMLMEKVNDGVMNYLEKKRLFFPRFFFLSNDDMLEILSETKDPLRVQPHLRKCFEGINRLRFNEELEILSIVSEDNEEVKLQEKISTAAARGCVERWLVQVEEQMVKSIRHEILMSYLDYEVTRRVVWVRIWPGMVVLCVSQIYWSMEVQNSLMTHIPSTTETLHAKLRSQILEMVELVRGSLSKQNRTTLNALITLDVHAMDVVKSLIDKKIADETDFEWLAQLRYYWEDDVFVRIIYTSVAYAYEYIGNCPRLVITPLTDRCYRTLVGAYSLHLNGAPEGPAGTGKTESTKDLSRALAVQCVVFNCSEGLDYKNMGKFFKGLASCGAWSCFDEFNRIELEVLSVVAQQILCIIQAVRADVETFIFEGTELKLNPAVYVCITMNPGYAGRSELPDNLKVLFRTVAMMVPDYAMIAEIFLYSSGFSSARELSTKIVTTYKLCSEQLSTQSHYDYGMRAVKTVLTAAQNIKLQFPDEDESVLLLRSVIDVNLPKFLAHDVPLFQGIVSDLFPGLELPSPSYDVLLKAVHEVAKKRNLQAVDGFLLKIIQTYEMMIVRHGFMLVGEPFGGKTCVLHTLADALTLMYEWNDENGARTKYYTINPKSITLGQLYGFFDPVSSEWTDGVCAVAFRRYCTEDSPDKKWIIFDGPVDAVWIENLNTVLDDNKKLCLTSGEVMQMSNVMSMIFEAMDLLHASPATVSRCGMIYIEPRVLGWEPFVRSWITELNPAWKEGHEENIRELFYWLIDPCLEFIRKTCRMTITAGQIHQVVTTMSLFEIYLEDAVEQNPKTYDQFILPWLQATMLTSVVWGAAGTLDYASRVKFNTFYMSIWKNEQTEHPIPEFIGESLISLPDDLIHDCFYTYRGRGAWRRFADTARQEEYLDTGSIVQLMIPTVDTVKYQTLFLKHISHRKRFLLYGETGTGKSFYIKDLIMNKLDEKDYLPNFITFTPNITAAQTQELVVLKLYKRRRNRFGPLPGTHCIVFIDDVNMPAKETYGSQPPIELLRQFFDHRLWFDLKKPETVRIYDTMFVCAMAPPGGSRQELYQRFLRHFSLFNIDRFSEDTVVRIFTNIAFIGLQRNGFTTAAMPTIIEIVNATMNIFNSAQKELRPTPTKSHYLFNLRDFSRVITGCAMIKEESVDSKSDFTKLWAHEILRVFSDRLIDEQDRHWLFLRIKEAVGSNLKESFDTVFGHLPKFDDQLTEESLRSLIFGTFMDIDTIPADRRYEEVKSMEEYSEVAISCLEEYNLTHRHKMDIVLFRYALEHLARICRILVIPCGSLLMVGVGGSGRQSLTKLASNMAGHGLFQPEMGSTYGVQEWRDDIKKILMNSGGLGKDYVFLLTEGQIKREIFLNDIDSLLNSGEVPNLFTIEERQEIIEATRLAAQGGNRNIDISVLSILAFFVNRCKEKLHIMLCFSPIGDTFRIRLRLYPSLVNCCTIDWFDVWPEDALEQVALRSTTHINIDEHVKINAVIACKFFHVCAKDISTRFYNITGRKTYVTTAGFLDLIQTYAKLMKEKQEELSAARNRYVSGLDKLEYAAVQIGRMRVTLSKLRPQLEASAKETAETMNKIETENISVEKARIMVKKDEDMANVQAKIAMNLKTECEADLAEALPALEEALAALDTLKPADIAVVRTMRSPPAGVRLVMAAVCVMLGIPPVRIEDPATGKKVPDYWGPSKRLLGDMRFLETLRQYDKDNIPSHIIQEIKTTYLTDKNFEPKVVARASSAAEGLCKWVRAMILYDAVVKVVAPKKAKLEAAEQDYENTMKFLNERREMLAELTKKLNILNERLQVTLAKKIELEAEVTKCRNQLIRAEKLISGLGGEKDRWTYAAENLQMSYDTLPGDILISCGMIAYLGPFTSIYRLESAEKWQDYVKSLKIPCSKTYDLVEVLGSEIKINSWNIFGLPRDLFSTENAIIMDNSKRWSLFVDPQSQANKWIRNMEKQNELEIVKLTDANYMNIIEQALEYGKPVLIENVLEDLTPPLDPILTKAIYKMGSLWYMTLGEKVIEYDLRFRLYITTKLRNPHYLPEIFNKVTLINFALTISALEDQLLGIVVAKERPDLQEKREYLIVQSAANRKALQQVEDNILRTLEASGASILEDEEAIEILDSSKLLSTDILRKQAAAIKTETQIEKFRQNYKPIARHSSALYYTITNLPNIDPMYQYSLVWFINLYINSIDTANKSKILERRLGFLRETFTYNLYQNVCRSLFEKDKLLYSFILYTTILVSEDMVTKEEITFFLSGGVALAAVPDNPASNWLPDKSWGEICRVHVLPSFVDFQASFLQNLNAWKQYYDLSNPENSTIPQPWENSLTPFQKLIVTRMIRTDKVMIMMQQFVEAGMGLKFVVPPPFDISKSYADSSSLVPLIFILSTGSDPMEALTKFAESMQFLERFNSISLGQGQGPIAQKLIEQAQNDGEWVCLQNCHLAASWMPMMESICERFDPSNTHVNFRLWLTSYPSDQFPITILQNGVKMTNEPPTGLQNNIMRSYKSEATKDVDFFDTKPSKKRTYSKLLYALCFFHAVVQERRNYGAQGWNIKYSFNESDLQISAQQLQLYINDYEDVPFKAIVYLTGECNYGGRVTDDRDRRCLNTILQDFYNQNVIADSNYTFADIGFEYALPKRHEYEDYIKQIQGIPLNPPPEVLGLHMNAGITRDLELANNFFQSMMLVQGTVVVGDTTKQDEMLLNMKDDIYNRMPELFDIEEAQKIYPVTYIESMNTVLIQELERYNTLLREIRQSLTMLEKAVKGLIVMTPMIEILGVYILSARIPPSWVKACAYPSLKPLPNFINDFLDRLSFFRKWLKENKPPTFWISGFSFVHAFLTATTQNFARKYKIPIDRIDFDFEVLPAYELRTSPVDGVYVYGMYLVGARWDIRSMLLAESYPKILWDPIPIIWLKPCIVDSLRVGERYECPLYITSARFGVLKTTGHSTNYVLSLLLDTDYPVSHWIKRGLALLCQLDN